MFQHPAEAILGTFTMSVGDFEDFTGIFATSRHPGLVAVSLQLNERMVVMTGGGAYMPW